MTDQNFSRIIEAAREHYENLKTDIDNASTRLEHIRLTALATEAHKLLTDLEMFEIGMVYTRINGLSEEDLARYQAVVNSREKLTAAATDLELDLPEFKSPYTPPVQ